MGGRKPWIRVVRLTTKGTSTVVRERRLILKLSYILFLALTKWGLDDIVNSLTTGTSAADGNAKAGGTESSLSWTFVTALDLNSYFHRSDREKALTVKRTRRKRLDLFQKSLLTHYPNYPKPTHETKRNAGNLQTSQEENLPENEPRILEEEEEEVPYECLYYNKAESTRQVRTMSYWSYHICLGSQVTQVRLVPMAKQTEMELDPLQDDDSNIMIGNVPFRIDAKHDLGNYAPPLDDGYYVRGNARAGGEPTVVLQEYKKGQQCRIEKKIGPSRMQRTFYVRRETKVEIGSCCDEGFQDENVFAGKSKRLNVVSVKEVTECRYSISICQICTNKPLSSGAHKKDTREDPKEEIKSSHDTLNSNRSDFIHVADLYNIGQSSSGTFPPMPPTLLESNRDFAKSMFIHGYDAYMYNAYPASDLKSKSCSPGHFHLAPIPALTLIDSLDTLILMGNYTEFARGLERLRLLDEQMKDMQVWENSNEKGGLFAVNHNASVFETNIRVVGGLLSAHQLAMEFLEDKVLMEEVQDKRDGSILFGDVVKPKLRKEERASQNMQHELIEDEGCIRNRNNGTRKMECEAYYERVVEYWSYDGILLSLAQDMGNRLLPAFATPTGIPYGTVNLLYGIPEGETTIASLAGAGTLSIEMELLSRLTGDESFGKAAKLAIRALWVRRSSLGLLGKHIDVNSGAWTETLSGIGSNSDSFYEYLLKHYILFPEDDDFFTMFQDSYAGVFHNSR